MRIAPGKTGILAIDGGRPIREALLPYGLHCITEDDIAAVTEVLRSSWVTTGPKVAEFEEAVASFVGARYAVSFSSGTAALHGAAFAAGLNPGDEAIVPPLTFCATANCVLYQGARPVFVDVDPETLLIDPEKIERSVTPRTRAILPVDYAGHPADLDKILEIADRHNLVVIEDACHALGAEYKGRRIGGISHMSVFSFHSVKHITTGEGGMVTTNETEYARRLRMFRNHGIDSEARQRQLAGQWRYDMVLLGYNYRLSDVGCALGISQLRRIGENLARRRQISAHYSSAFAHLSTVTPPGCRSEVGHAWHLYPVRWNLEKLDAGRNEIVAALRAENIGVNVHYLPVHLHSFYREQFGYQGGEFPVAEQVFERLVTLPIFQGMTEQDVADVIQAVKKVSSAFYRR